MSETTANLSLPLLQPSQAQKHVTHNEALRLLDTLVQLSVQRRDTGVPPDVPIEGERHIVGAAATGVWAGQEGRIAQFSGASWNFLAPQPGWRAHVVAESAEALWTGSSWEGAGERSMRVAALGVNAAADVGNPLTVAASSTLLNHAGGDHRLKINKAGTNATASLLFQSGFSGHAEMGLAGSKDFAVKVSADGQSWREAIRFDATSGLAAGSAVQSGPLDAAAGRLMATGAFGIGGHAPLVGNANALSAGGSYAYQSAAGSSGGPAGIVSGHLWHSSRAGSSSQILISDAMAHVRSGSASGWGAWRRLDPEYGANANGDYLRLPDGTQICSAVLNDVGAPWNTQVAAGFFSRAEPLLWTYPAAFTSIRSVTATAGFTTDRRAVGAGLRAIGSTSAEVQPWTSGAMVASDPKRVFLMAVGRWY